MSTPSTATATIPGSHRYYPHYQNYDPIPPPYHASGPPVHGGSRLANTTYAGYSTPASASDLRRTASTNQRQTQAQQLPPPQPSQLPASAMPTPNKRDRQPDWNEFYKNGLPKEVIVIDDDDDDEAAPARDYARSYQQPAAAAASNGSSRHADKKRKTAVSTGWDPVYSATQTPHSEHYSNYTGSTDRTTSAIHTTAATSLGSTASNGTYAKPDDSVVGQKRKRTRAAVFDEAEEAKRREIERQDAYANYVPPPRPPIKAKDVNVKVVQDKTYHKDEKVDDDDGHYNVVPDAELTERYTIVKLLGQGTFGKVVEAYDKRERRNCAIKVIRSVQKYRDASRIELRVLTTLASNDRHNRNRCIHLRDCFDFRNHICIVTDLYSQSVFDFLKSNQFVPFPSTHIQHFARQLFTSVAFLHDLNLIHTDLKPENILLVNSAYQTFTYGRPIPSSSHSTSRTSRHRKVLLDPEIRLIDFGSATFNDEYHSSVVSTRHYRAPEIILNLGWSYPCDIWSIGCILVEFFTGDALFQTHDNLEHLAMMESVCGAKLDRDLIRSVCKMEKGQSKNSAAAYFKNSKLDYPNSDTNRASRKYVKAMKKLNETIPPYTDFNVQFLDLLKKIFVYNPAKRITAKDALKHPWFRESMQDDGTEATKIRIQKEQRQQRQAEKRRQQTANGYH